MFGIGMPELVMILVVALLVLGPSRLPQVARTLGKGMREFRKASDDLRTAMWVDLDEERPRPVVPPPASLPPPSPAQATADQTVTMVESSQAGRFTPESNPSTLPVAIDLGGAVVDKAAPAQTGMPRAAEGIVARGSPFVHTAPDAGEATRDEADDRTSTAELSEAVASDTSGHPEWHKPAS